MSSIEPDDRGSEVDRAKKVSGGFIVAGRNGAKLFESGEAVFNQMPCLVELLSVGAGDRSVGFRRDHDGLAGCSQWFNHSRIGIKRLVGNNGVRIQTGEQRIGPVQIMRLSRREINAQRVAQRIAGGVDFGGQSALAPPDGFPVADVLGRVAPFFRAPAAC